MISSVNIDAFLVLNYKQIGVGIEFVGKNMCKLLISMQFCISKTKCGVALALLSFRTTHDEHGSQLQNIQSR